MKAMEKKKEKRAIRRDHAEITEKKLCRDVHVSSSSRFSGNSR